MKYYDLVELIKENPAYTEAGAKVGNFGTVMSKEPVDGKWRVVFTNTYTGVEYADVMVLEEDLKAFDRTSKDIIINGERYGFFKSYKKINRRPRF